MVPIWGISLAEFRLGVRFIHFSSLNVGLVFVTAVSSGLKQDLTGSGSKSTMKKLEL